MLGEGSREQQMHNLKNAVLERVKSAVCAGDRQGLAGRSRCLQADARQRGAAGRGARGEGGFLGFGGVRVSDKEKAFIAEVKGAAGIT